MNFHERLLDLPELKSMLKNLSAISVSSSLPGLLQENIRDSVDWPYLLKCASALAFSSQGKCQAAALRISHACLTSTETTENEKTAAGVILDTLTNYPALNLAVKKNILNADFKNRLPTVLKLDSVAREIESSIPGDDSLRFTRFQKSLFVALEKNKFISVSAPTSAGKSFVLSQFVAQYISNNSKAMVIYIVPTRALIQQCESDFQRILSKLDPKPIITSVPQLPDSWEENKCLLVLTQERFHWILNNVPNNFEVDLLVVDEAQKVGDSARGILLQQVIEDTLKRSPKVKVLFSSPMSKNPGILLKNFSLNQNGTVMDSDDVTVNQNLIWVSQVMRHPKQWTASLCIENDVFPLGSFKLTSTSTSEIKRVPCVAHSLMGPSSGNLIYMNGQADAEKAARYLWELLGKENETDDTEILELINLVKKVVHKDYLLGEVLNRRVAFHYGNMPIIIRNEIEKLFKEEKLFYLVCTSTLLEGVNLPAKTIFLRSPSRGRGVPLSSIDFWNLAGRAGRLGKEFQGNVICVDPEVESVWKEPPPRHRARYDIEFSFDKMMTKPELIEDYYKKDTPRKLALENPELEQVAVYLADRYLVQKTLLTPDLIERFTEPILSSLEMECKSLIEKVEIPEVLIKRNPGISPLAQQKLLDYFRNYEGDPNELIPLNPKEYDSAKNSYIHIVGRINTHLSGEGHYRDFYLAILAVNWMSGYSLARIISENYEYWKTRNKKLPAVIRDTMRDIEEYARFKFVKYSSCYVDVLRLHFSQINREDLSKLIPQLNIWLEFGASQQTQISLIGLGISRTSSIEISELIGKDDLSREACIEWLKQNDIEKLNVSEIIKKEVRRIKIDLMQN